MPSTEPSGSTPWLKVGNRWSAKTPKASYQVAESLPANSYVTPRGFEKEKGVPNVLHVQPQPDPPAPQNANSWQLKDDPRGRRYFRLPPITAAPETNPQHRKASNPQLCRSAEGDTLPPMPPERLTSFGKKPNATQIISGEVTGLNTIGGSSPDVFCGLERARNSGSRRRTVQRMPRTGTSSINVISVGQLNRRGGSPP